MHRADRTDLAYLRGDATIEGLREALAIAREHRPRGLCLNPAAADYLAHPEVRLALLDTLPHLGILRQFAIDFPLGQGGAGTKLRQAEVLLDPVVLADEFDVVANIGALVAGDFERFAAELRPVIALGRPVKVIVETGHYAGDDTALTRAVDWCAEVGAFAIKTSTGFLQNLDNAEKRRHVRLWAARIAEHAYPLEIKDAGGKRTREDVDLGLEAGADVVGASQVIL